jgi:hypothetical protein
MLKIRGRFEIRTIYTANWRVRTHLIYFIPGIFRQGWNSNGLRRLVFGGTGVERHVASIELYSSELIHGLKVKGR